MTHLPKAPLAYTIGVVRFPTVPGLDRFAPEFHEAVRARFPHQTKKDIKRRQLELSPDGAVRINEDSATVWQFASPDRKHAYVLTPDVLAFHTVAYRDHQSFIEEFRGGLKTLCSVQDINIIFVLAVAIRYVNLIVEHDQSDLRLHKYFADGILPEQFTSEASFEFVEGVNASRYKTPSGEVRLQISQNPATVLPADLVTPFIQANGWKSLLERPTSPFAIVDEDCAYEFPDGSRIDIDRVCDHIYELRCLARSMFKHIGSGEAFRIWKGEP